mmetsp:Transcript_31951/g.38615  ORF Transcript_31951/g.38615 Transcript_31951/m.38615 type:complete len:129 (+) Transcript_31951:54-440(+)|eukprot:CAMPEP_0197846100 /NCGR_PEP_ID=MMETSP1438-20131217/2907_1 /TAXON_ID=1461541 /ORGANISM="Pterosperma sp., Strain CCMP1384" /LENGTH=128 /DNA_ID=CAMNT_0043457621 /DNA_START=65 /DNA_END=451 /DNA_ORIENTATION=+
MDFRQSLTNNCASSSAVSTSSPIGMPSATENGLHDERQSAAEWYMSVKDRVRTGQLTDEERAKLVDIALKFASKDKIQAVHTRAAAHGLGVNGRGVVSKTSKQRARMLLRRRSDYAGSLSTISENVMF